MDVLNLNSMINQLAYKNISERRQRVRQALFLRIFHNLFILLLVIYFSIKYLPSYTVDLSNDKSLSSKNDSEWRFKVSQFSIGTNAVYRIFIICTREPKKDFSKYVPSCHLDNISHP